MKYTIADKKSILDRIEKLKLRFEENIQIFLIIKKYKIKFNENQNGIWVDFRGISNNEALNEINKILDICENTRNEREN